jgi:hypothetical protein
MLGNEQATQKAATKLKTTAGKENPLSCQIKKPATQTKHPATIPQNQTPERISSHDISFNGLGLNPIIMIKWPNEKS